MIYCSLLTNASKRVLSHIAGYTKGRFQNWKKPVYEGPYVNPLELGPDFSFIDGRVVHVTSKAQLEYKLDQIRLGKRVVTLLEDIRKMENAHEKAEKERISEVKEQRKNQPISKGNQYIS